MSETICKLSQVDGSVGEERGRGWVPSFPGRGAEGMSCRSNTPSSRSQDALPVVCVLRAERPYCFFPNPFSISPPAAPTRSQSDNQTPSSSSTTTRNPFKSSSRSKDKDMTSSTSSGAIKKERKSSKHADVVDRIDVRQPHPFTSY